MKFLRKYAKISYVKKNLKKAGGKTPPALLYASVTVTIPLYATE